MDSFFDLLMVGLNQVLTIEFLIYIFIGSFIGIVFAAIPGLSTGMAVILALPLTYGMSSIEGLTMMTGIYIGGMSGGLISACLLGIPGTSSAVATTFDGYPMAKGGNPGRAIGIGVWASFFGGLVGAIALMLFAPLIARFATKFGPWEYFSLVLFGLTIIAGVSGGAMLKGLIAGLLGLVLGMVGSDPLFGTPRMTFGISALKGGIDFIPLLIGIFAISQLMGDLEEDEKEINFSPQTLKIPHIQCIKDIFKYKMATSVASFIGLLVGALPGAGATISNMWAYDQVKKLSKNRDKFGTGEPEGIIAAEASNSATAGGSLIPMLALGVPGNAISAIMMGAVIIHGIAPGPLFITSHPDLAYGLFIAFIVANFSVVLLQSIFTNLYTKILIVPRSYMIPIVLVFCVVGSFANNNMMSDIFIMLIAGILGYAMAKLKVPIASLVLGHLLGILLEENFRAAYMTSSNLLLFVTRPISIFFILLSVFSVIYNIRQETKAKNNCA